jgi:CPA1 family monovalent cation:H+ antiporter
MQLGFLFYADLVLLVIVLIGFFNEKVTKLTYEIALMLFSVLAGILIAVGTAIAKDMSFWDVLNQYRLFDIGKFLMEGVLCFMLFAGSCHAKLSDFKRLARPVGVLALLGTLLGSVFYGLLFYGFSHIMGLGFSLPLCLLFGSIIAPTDPIAATSILNKFGLPKDVSFVIEGESLLNDGVGVALFVCLSGMVTKESSGGFLTVMLREIAGAVIIGAAVTFVLFQIFKRLENEKLRIFVSLLCVSLAYSLCELLECSGALASVVCGVLFAYFRDKEEAKNGPMELGEFDGFWEILDTLLNSILYVMLGVSFIRIVQLPYVVIMSLAAIICNFAGRFGSLFLSTFAIGDLPGGYDKKRFCMLLTWGGLRGGLSIALAMSTVEMLDVDSYLIIQGCTYAVVFFTTVVQGLTMKRMYQGLSKKA